MAKSLQCLVAALALGLMADALLRVGPWGLNASLCACAFAACLAIFAPSRRKQWAIPVAVFGLFVAWRDSYVLKALDLLAIAAACATIALRPAIERLSRTTLVHYAESLLDSVAGLIAGAPQMVWKELYLGNYQSTTSESRRYWLRIAGNCGIGLLLAIPLLLVFGALFMSADFAFRSFVHSIVRLEWEDFFEHVYTIAVVFWWSAGFFYVLALDVRVDIQPYPGVESLRLNPLQLFIPLGMLNALFVAFIAVQLRYFFGGDALITDSNGPTYAEYAREGFFQLVAVAALALLVLYTMDWFNRNATPLAQRYFRALAGLLVILVYIVMASAMQRMYLYFQAYGLTQLRFYTSAFMIWLAIVLAAFALTVLIARRDRFVMATLALAWVAVIAMNLANPDAIIVRANAARADRGEPFDARYLGSLSADAVPALSRLSSDEIAGVALKQFKARLKNETSDWRAWSLSRHRAFRALSAQD